jgi:hypothetical protein
VVAGAHDFNAWNQLFTIFARDYLWKPEAFLAGEIDVLEEGVASTSLNQGNRKALTVKLDQALRLVTMDRTSMVDAVLNGFVLQVEGFRTAGKLTEGEAAALVDTAEKIIANVGYWE